MGQKSTGTSSVRDDGQAGWIEGVDDGSAESRWDSGEDELLSRAFKRVS